MKRFSRLLMGGVFLVLSQGSFASNDNSKLTYNPAALQPGSRIVAGDLSKNEFFILANNNETKEDKSRSVTTKKTIALAAPTKSKTSLQQKPATKAIKVALKKALNLAKNKSVTLSKKKSIPTVMKQASVKAKIATSKKTDVKLGKQHAAKTKSAVPVKINKTSFHALTSKKPITKEKIVSQYKVKKPHQTLKS